MYREFALPDEGLRKKLVTRLVENSRQELDTSVFFLTSKVQMTSAQIRYNSFGDDFQRLESSYVKVTTLYKRDFIPIGGLALVSLAPLRTSWCEGYYFTCHMINTLTL